MTASQILAEGKSGWFAQCEDSSLGLIRLRYHSFVSVMACIYIIMHKRGKEDLWAQRRRGPKVEKTQHGMHKTSKKRPTDNSQPR
jgi:hypothetical protein